MNLSKTKKTLQLFCSTKSWNKETWRFVQRQGGKKEIRVWCLFKGHCIADIVEIRLSNEKRAPGCSFRMPVRARSGVPTYHRYLLFFFFFLIQGAFFWVGVGWGGDVNVPCTCTHTWCYAIGCFLHLHTYLMLRHRMFLVGLGWGGDVNVPCTCTHTWCYAIGCSCTCTHTWCYAIGCFLHLHTYLMLRHRMFLVGLGWGFFKIHYSCFSNSQKKIAKKYVKNPLINNEQKAISYCKFPCKLHMAKALRAPTTIRNVV